MSAMRLTMIVHSKHASEQEAVIHQVELPLPFDGEAWTEKESQRLLGALAQHIDDELKYMQEQEESEQELAEAIVAYRANMPEYTWEDVACTCDTTEDIDEECPVHGIAEIIRQLRKEGTGGGEPGIPREEDSNDKV